MVDVDIIVSTSALGIKADCHVCWRKIVMSPILGCCRHEGMFRTPLDAAWPAGQRRWRRSAKEAPSTTATSSSMASSTLQVSRM